MTRHRPHSGAQPANSTSTVFTTSNGRELLLRAIEPDDEAALLRAFARLTPEQIRLRVFHRMNALSPEVARWLCKTNPLKTSAYVAVDRDGEIRGDARIYIDADKPSAEFAIVVDPALTGMGVGLALMQRLLDESRARDLDDLWGDVLTENASMLDLADRLGAKRESIAGEPGLVRVRFALAGTPSAA